MKKMLLLLLVVLLSVPYSFGQAGFTDVDQDHWAYEAIMILTERGVLGGYADGTFRPNEGVSRAEFAKIMVRTLGMDTLPVTSSPFADVDLNHWALPFIKAASPYLTGYRYGDELRFKPDEPALREDMAVALVGAKAYDLVPNPEAYLADYQDLDMLETSLRPYVATAIKEGIMVGLEEGGKRYFQPKETLTRAQAASLLMKVTLKEEKVVLGEDLKEEPGSFVLAGQAREGDLYLSWSGLTQDGLKGLKVVASKTNPSPSYPEDGYLYYLEDTSLKGIELNPYIKVHGGEVEKLLPGQTYYFAITALYDDQSISSNTIRLTMPGPQAAQELILEGAAKDHGIVLEWTGLEGADGYKIVASEDNEDLTYPEDGYYAYVGGDKVRQEIMTGATYHGDFSSFEGGQSYYFRVIAFMKDGSRIPSEVISLGFPQGEEQPSVTLSHVGYEEGIKIEWSKEAISGFKGYKLVIAKEEDQPRYPENGYLAYLTDPGTNSYWLKAGMKVHNGDLDLLKSGDQVYVAITVLTASGNYSSNTIMVTIP